MADIELVIKIPEGTKEQIIALTNLGESFPPKLQERIVRAIINGIPLPKGHGRLIDEDQIPGDNGWDFSDRLASTPTIIEADESEVKDE